MLRRPASRLPQIDEPGRPGEDRREQGAWRTQSRRAGLNADRAQDPLVGGEALCLNARREGDPPNEDDGALAAVRGALTRFFRSRAIPAEEIDDLVQEVFLRIVRRGGSQALDNIEAYAMATASSVIADRSRRRTSHHVDAHVSFHPDLHAGQDLAPDRILAGREALHATTRALMELPERTRRVFILRRLEGLPFREIAVRLGISLSAAEKDMLAAIRHLAPRAGDII
jgi:RNA polymerase sigma factor (sigma-70 family)